MAAGGVTHDISRCTQRGKCLDRLAGEVGDDDGD